MFSRTKASSDDQDWVVSATDMIEGVIDKVRDGAVVKLATAARAIVYGLLMGIVGIAALVLVAIFIVRLLDIVLDFIPMVPENVWFAQFIAGLLFVVAGMFVWSKRSPKAANAKGNR